MHKLLCLFCISGLEYSVFVIVPDIIRLYFGPFNPSICLLKNAARKALIFQVLLILNAIIISRYILIFILKSSFILEENFWALFIMLWIKAFAFVIVILVPFLGENTTMHYFICCGCQPESSTSTWKLQVSHIASTLTVVLYVVILARITYFKYKMVELRLEEWMSVGELYVCLFHAGAYALGAAGGMLLATIHSQDLNVFPNYIYEWHYSLSWPCLVSFMTAMSYYIRHKGMRDFLVHKVYNLIIMCKPSKA